MEDKKYYKVVVLNFYLIDNDILIGYICTKYQDFIYYFPKIDENLVLTEKELEEITKNEYVRELWKIENTSN